MGFVTNRGSTRSKAPQVTRSESGKPIKAPIIEEHTNLMEGTSRKTTSNDRSKARESKPGESKVKYLPIDGMKIPVTDSDLYKITASKIGIYKMLIDVAMVHGYRFQFDPHAQGFNNHRILKYKDPKPVNGIQVPAGYKVLLPINTSELDTLIGIWDQATKEITKTIQARISDSKYDPDEELTHYPTFNVGSKQFRVDFSLEPGTSLNGKDPEKETARAAVRAIRKISGMVNDFELSQSRAFMSAGQIVDIHDRDEIDYRISRSIGLDGRTPYGTRWVVPLSWYQQDLSKITDEQLLPLLEDSEREAFMLFLGRCMLGRQDTVLNTGSGLVIQDLRWRQFAVWEGREGGMGRTSTLEMLTDALKTLGYSAGAIDDLTGRFGHGKTARLDFGFIDDTSADHVIAILKNGNLKTLSSGGTLKTEEKGLMSEEVTAQGVYMVATNRIEPSKLSDLDAGNISRIMAIHNRTSTESGARNFQDKHGYTVHADQGYARLAEDYGVDVRCLVMLLLSRSAELFRKYLGRGKDLVSDLHSIQQGFVRKITMSYTDGVLREFARILEYTAPNRIKEHKFDLRLLIAGLVDSPRQIEHCDNTKDEIEEVARASNDGRLGPIKQYERFFSVLLSEDGSRYPTEVSYWVDQWRSYRERYEPTFGLQNYQELRSIANAQDCDISEVKIDPDSPLGMWRAKGAKLKAMVK